MDYASALYDPIYTIQGVSATLTLAGGATVLEDLTVLDKTSGVDTGEGGAQVATIKPAACVRVYDLTARGVVVDQLPRATLVMNDFEWKVTSYKLRPAPTGENQGEVLLILAGKVALDSESE